MLRFLFRNCSIFTFLGIPILAVWNPRLFSIMDIQPNWPIFWLLPWSIINGPINGSLTGLFLGIILDILNNDFYTQIPGFIICGFWFGKVGFKNKKQMINYQYGLLASIGCFICGIIYFVQILLNHLLEEKNFFLFNYGLKIISTQIFLTGLLAPVFCYWLFVLFKYKKRLNF